MADKMVQKKKLLVTDKNIGLCLYIIIDLTILCVSSKKGL